MLRKTKRNLHRPDKEKRKTLPTLSQSLTPLHPYYVGPSPNFWNRPRRVHRRIEERKRKKKGKGIFHPYQSLDSPFFEALCSSEDVSGAHLMTECLMMSFDLACVRCCVLRCGRCSRNGALCALLLLSLLCSRHLCCADCPKKEGPRDPPECCL